MNRYGLAIVRVFREARRRKVFRTGALYVVGAWLALQVADVLFPGFGIPGAAIQTLVWAAVLGLPVALAFGWLFDIGAGGIRRTPPLGAGETAPPRTLGRSDYAILAVFAAVAGMLVYDAVQDVRETPRDSTAADAEAGRDRVARLENSIAVLPFANISNDPDNEYFCDGISEEILNKLAGIRELNVIGRTSSFAFKDSAFGIQRISQILRVRFVLQGSVRKSDGQLRISAQLLDTDGVQVWSESFDREPRNIFDIQAEIASEVARTVASHLVPMGDPGHQPVLAAYDHYLAGRGMLHGRDAIGATRELQRAVELDPDFAEAHAELGISTLIVGDEGYVDRARASIDRALELKPRLLRAQAAQGLWLMQEETSDPVAAERVLREVLAQDPNMSDALNWLTNALNEQGRAEEARPILERAARIDPLHPAIAANLAGQLYEAGDVDGAMRLLERQLEQPKPGFMIYGTLFDIYRATGRLVELNALAKQEALSHPERPYISLGLSYTLLGDYASAEAWNTRSMRAFPDHPAPRFIAVALPAHQGRHENVGRQLAEIFGSIRTPPAGAPSLDLWLTGAMLARAGEYQSAIAFLEPLVDPAAPDNTYFSPAPELYGLHALAWAYLHAGADDKAARLLESAARWCDQKRTAGPLRDGLMLHRCAETLLLQGNVDRALAEFDRAVAAGWRDFYVRQKDPYWVMVQDRPAYRALIDKVQADIARQRTEVARVDSGDAFAETLTAARAERMRTSK